jgi:trans-aconitate methyltransferase
MYRSNKWQFNEANNEIIALVEKHAANGSILMLGCGTATILNYLNHDQFSYFCGIDISPEAIARANTHISDKINFEVADILGYKCNRDFDVILFSESLYYVPAARHEELLNNLCLSLAPNGCIIVTLSDPERYANIVELVEQKFCCLQNAKLRSSSRRVLVFTRLGLTAASQA